MTTHKYDGYGLKYYRNSVQKSEIFNDKKIL